MKAKVKTTGEIIEVEYFGNGAFGRIDGPVAIYTRRLLDFNISAPEKAVIEGWICRDKNNNTDVLARRGSKLYLCQNKPKRIASLGEYDKGGDFYRIPEEYFPTIAFESEPRKARLEITLIDEKGGRQ